MQYKPIKSLAQYKSYESYLEKMLLIENRSATEQQSVDELISLIVDWDQRNDSSFAILPKPPPVDPVNILEKLMKEHNMSSTKLAAVLGISQSGISDILNGRMELTADMIMEFAKRFAVDPDIFLKYECRS